MSSLDKAGGASNQHPNVPKITQEGQVIKGLPLELFQKTLSYLDKESAEQAALVDRNWNTVSIDTVKREECSKIENFMKFLADNLEGSAKEQLLAANPNKKILNLVNLTQVKASILDLRENIINILKNLQLSDLEKLEELSQNESNPSFFENIFWITQQYKKIEGLIAGPYNALTSHRLSELVENLVGLGCLEKAIQTADVIPNTWIPGDPPQGSQYHRTKALSCIVKVLAKKGDIDKAQHVVNMIAKNKREKGLQYIVEALIEKGDIDNAVKTTHIMHNCYEKYEALLVLSKAFLGKGDIDKAMEFAIKIPDENTDYQARSARSQALYGILEELRNKENLDKAIELVHKMSEEDRNQVGLCLLVKALVKQGNIDKAIEVAEMISNDRTRNYAYKEIPE